MKKTVIRDCTLVLGDCLEMLETIPPGSISCCFTDPPYGISYVPNSRTMLEKPDMLANDDKPRLDFVPPIVRTVRYADDWCVFLTRSNKERAAELRQEIADFLDKECGLRLSEEKTRIIHVRDGFDFLGFHLKVSIGQRNNPVPKIKVGAKAITNIRKRIDESLRYRAQQESMALRIRRTSRIIRGGSNYFCIAHDFGRAQKQVIVKSPERRRYSAGVWGLNHEKISYNSTGYFRAPPLRMWREN